MPLEMLKDEQPAEKPPAKLKVFKDGQPPDQHEPTLATEERSSQSQSQDGPYAGKAGKARKFKVQGETQTSQCISFIIVCVYARLTLISQNEIRLADQLQVPPEEHSRANNDYAYSGCNG